MEASTRQPAGRDSQLDQRAREAALRLGFGEPLSPLAYQTRTDEQLLWQVQAEANGATRQQCLDAIVTVRRLCELVCAFAEIYHEGGFGEGATGRENVLRELAARIPGFSPAEYEAAFNASLIWTAF